MVFSNFTGKLPKKILHHDLTAPSTGSLPWIVLVTHLFIPCRLAVDSSFHLKLANQSKHKPVTTLTLFTCLTQRKVNGFFRTLRVRKLLVTKLRFFFAHLSMENLLSGEITECDASTMQIIIQFPLCCRSEPLASWWLAVSILEPLLGADGANK